MNKPIRFAFNSHGLGDVVHAATCLRLYIAAGYDVQIAVEHNKRWVWQAAEIPIYDGPHVLPIHPYYYLPSQHAFFDLSLPEHSSSKIAGFFDVDVLPKLGTKDSVWRAVCNEQVDASDSVSAEAYRDAERLIDGLPRPIILLHTKGSNWQAEKSIPDATAFALLLELVASFDGSVITLDWDSRSPTLDHPRVRPAGRIALDTFAALCLKSDLLIGIDSGPFHLAQWLPIQTLFVARDIPPVRCCIPNGRATYLVPAAKKYPRSDREQWRFAEFQGAEATPLDIMLTAFRILGDQARKTTMQPAPQTIPGEYLYRRCGYDERPLELLADGTIGDGGAGCERTWKLTDTPAGLSLVIYGDGGRDTCHLKLMPDGVWRGNWLRHERMPIELIRDTSRDPIPQSSTWDDLVPMELTESERPFFETGAKMGHAVETAILTAVCGDLSRPLVDLNDGQLHVWQPAEAAELFPNYDPAWNLPVGSRGNGMIWLLDPAVERSDLDSCGIDHEDWIYPHLSQPPGAVCLDLASFIGTNAIWWAKSGCKVIACEPMPRSRALLEKNIQLNYVGNNIIVIPKAFGDCPGTTMMRSDLHYASYTGTTGDVEVIVTTVDQELLPLLDRLDIIKLDVEGAECEVIDGARETILRFKPKIVIEVHSHMDGRAENGAILTRQLNELGYTFRRIWTNIETYYYIEATPK